MTVSVAIIIECAAQAFDVAPRMIRSARRDRKTTDARLAVYWVAQRETEQAWPAIARLIGGRDHTTALHGARSADERRGTDPEFRARLDAVRLAVQTIARSEIAGLIADADAVAAAERIVANPLREATRVSTLETVAMAARLLDLEELAGGTFRLLAQLDALRQCEAGGQAMALRADARALIPTIASALAALGYVNDDQPETPDDNSQDQGGAAAAPVAAE